MALPYDEAYQLLVFLYDQRDVLYQLVHDDTDEWHQQGDLQGIAPTQPGGYCSSCLGRGDPLQVPRLEAMKVPDRSTHNLGVHLYP